MKHKISAIVLCILLISCTIILVMNYFNKDEQSKGWVKTFGGTQNDEGYFVQQTKDGGYIITGETWSSGSDKYDVLLMKTNGDGDLLWNRTFGGIDDDVGLSVLQTIDDGYIITGYTQSFGAGDWDVWLIKTDGDSDMIWNRTFGGINADLGMSIQQTTDGGYIITGHTELFDTNQYDVMLIKTNDNGDMLWNKTFGGTKQDLARCVQQTSDGGYIITGYTQSFGVGDWDVWLIKTDSDGDMIWNRTFGGTDNDWGWTGQQTTDRGYIIVGGTNSFGAGESDVWLIKTDNNGEKVWDKTFGGTDDDRGNSAQQTTDGGYVITGYLSSVDTDDTSVWLIKTDSNGEKVWERIFGGNDLEFGRSVQQTTDGGYIITGHISSFSTGINDVLLIKAEK